ncbi:MAG: hypothetical protein IPI93_03110 [Sphingobacteriaceae bacterium]|nr:hypothetical protein [Sphingobacteriaceae bacterium]MBK7309789.1 hypothetical protein [Sphingobacteriaceae bacterium]
MKSIFKYIILTCILFLISDCKKYDEGGFVKQTRKHLFGNRKDGATKTWKLKLYEVNGIDSTLLILGANQIPDFYENYITFKLDNKEGFTYTAETFLCNYVGAIDNVYKEITITKPFPNHLDSLQCKVVGSNTICTRNLLLPEGFFTSSLWKIKRLKKDELIITNENLKNKYKIIFSQ